MMEQADPAKDAAKDAKTKTAKKAKTKPPVVLVADHGQAITQDGDQCKRKPAAGSRFCLNLAARRVRTAPRRHLRLLASASTRFA